MNACLIEGLVCCVTGFWCVFCCHTCIRDGIGGGEMQQIMQRSNTQFFNGAPVLSRTANGGFCLNTSLIPPKPEVMFGHPQSAVLLPQGQVTNFVVGQQVMTLPQGQPIYGATPSGYAAVPSAQPIYGGAASVGGLGHVPMGKIVNAQENNQMRTFIACVPLGVYGGGSFVAVAPDGRPINVRILISCRDAITYLDAGCRATGGLSWPRSSSHLLSPQLHCFPFDLHLDHISTNQHISWMSIAHMANSLQ